MFEVDIDVAVACKRREAFDECLDFGLRVGAGAAKAKAGVGRGGMNLGGSEVIALGDAESSVVRPKDAVDLFGEP